MFLVKDLISAKQDKNEKLVNNINDGLIDLWNVINRKEITENENLKKVVNIVEKILNFNEKRKGKRHPSDLGNCIKMLTPKQMPQRLTIALAEVKAGNTSENVLNQIRKVLSSLYRGKEVTKKVHNNIFNLIKL